MWGKLSPSLRALAVLAAVLAVIAAAGAASAAAPGNDSFAGAQVLRAATGSYNGTNREAAKERGEPAHANNAGGASVWYRWTAPATGVATFDTFGSGFDTTLAVYTGSSLEALVPVASNDDALGWKWTSKVGFAAVAGTTYSIAVDGYSDGITTATGTFALNWELDAGGNPGNDAFAMPVPLSGTGSSVTGSSFGATREVGEPVHAGNPGGRSVWFVWTAPADGRYRFETQGSAFNTLLAVYEGVALTSLTPVVSNDDLAWNDWSSRVMLDARKDATYVIAVDGYKAPYSGTASGDYALTWSLIGPAAGAPANDWYSTATLVSAATGSLSDRNVGAGKEAGEPNHAGDAGGASVWYRWTAPADGTATFATAGSSFDTVLAAYTGVTVTGLTMVAANDDVGAKGPSRITFNVVNGTTYYLAVDGYNSGSAATGDIALAWEMTPSAPPSNDSFAGPVEMGGTGGIYRRTSLGATKEPGEPAHAGNAGGASVWFTWRAPADGVWRVYTTGSTFDTLLGVYTGDTVDALVQVGANDNVSASDRTSSVTFTARNDTRYRIAVDGLRGATGSAAAGSFTLMWELVGAPPDLPSNDNLAAAREIVGRDVASTASNVGATKEANEPDHAGNAGGASLWFRWTAPATGTVYFDTPGSSFDTLLAVYRGTSYADLVEVAANDDIAYNHYWRSETYPTSYVSFWANAGETFLIAVDGRSTAGRPPETGSVFLDLWQFDPPGEARLFAAGDVASCATDDFDVQTAALLATDPTASVAALGDLAYPNGSVAEFACYDATWGAHKERTAPVVGNREYNAPGAAPYWSYWGAKAGAAGKGWYSYELGAWHVVVLNSNCGEVACGYDSAQERWLREDLTAHRTDCTIAYMHHPLFSSSPSATPAVQQLWRTLYQYGTDVVLSAHAHMYERFAPQTPDGVRAADGMRQFVVGTGGNLLHASVSPAANSEYVNSTAYGVLKLSLLSGGYSWQFLQAGGALVDAGTGGCSGAAAPRDGTPAPGQTAPPDAPSAPGPPAPERTVTRARSLGLEWTRATDPNGYGLLYRVEGADASGAWNALADMLDRPEGDVALAEGTWQFRARAYNGKSWGLPSTPSVPVVADWTPPVPSFTVSRPPDYPGGGGWWRGSVTVTSNATDPQLRDGSPGSGVVLSSIDSPETKSGTGVFKIGERAKDVAGNESAEATFYLQLDSSVPSVSLSCPGGTLPNGSERHATYAAKDDRSGLAVPATGTVRLDTTTKGKKIASFTALDNVGNAKTATCSYTVG